jgi:hypothetical protein
MCSYVNINGGQSAAADRNERVIGIEEYSDRIAQEMHERVEMQRAILRQLLAEGGNRVLRVESGPPAGGSDLARMKAALMETIEVLEETKCSFKSRRLEVMRKKLIAVLAGD